jgi:hypothetical protein
MRTLAGVSAINRWWQKRVSRSMSIPQSLKQKKGADICSLLFYDRLISA